MQIDLLFQNLHMYYVNVKYKHKLYNKIIFAHASIGLPAVYIYYKNMIYNDFILDLPLFIYSLKCDDICVTF